MGAVPTTSIRALREDHELIRAVVKTLRERRDFKAILENAHANFLRGEAATSVASITPAPQQLVPGLTFQEFPKFIASHNVTVNSREEELAVLAGKSLQSSSRTLPPAPSPESDWDKAAKAL